MTVHGRATCKLESRPESVLYSCLVTFEMSSGMAR